jgi:hypothetical protein
MRHSDKMLYHSIHTRHDAMRLPIFLFLISLSLNAVAGQPLPNNLQPLPEPPQMLNEDALDEPSVNITKQTELTVEEFRSNGKLYMIKVTPKHGLPYYLVDDRGDGKFARQEGLDSGLRPPRWVIKSF